MNEQRKTFTLNEYMYYPTDKEGMEDWIIKELPTTYPTSGVSILSVEATSPTDESVIWKWRFETNPTKSKINHLGKIEYWSDVALVSITHNKVRSE